MQKNRVSDMIKKENEQKEAMLDNFRMKEEEHNKNERRLEEKIIRLQVMQVAYRCFFITYSSCLL